MKYVPRLLEKQIALAARRFPAIVLTGPRRAGKTSLLRRLFPKAGYFLLEYPDVLARIESDPHGFLDDLKTPVILDEVQNAPQVFAHVRARIDRRPKQNGQWILTGSQEAPLMQGVSESMAGRAAVLQLYPLSAVESPKVSQLRGGYPEVLAKPRSAGMWFEAYLQTYIERDVRSITAVRDLATFRRFIALVASRHGQMLNRSDLAAPLGVSVPTINQWLNVLEMTLQVLIIPSYYENFGKRLVKAPKLYIADSGLACHLLRIESQAELNKSPFRGAIFEGFVASETVKHQVNMGRRRELYYFRDEQGLEVDFVLPRKNRGIALIECKASKTVTPEMAAPIGRLADTMRKKSADLKLERYVVHERSDQAASTTAIAPGVKALAWRDFVERL